ncbi:mitochondrial distribution and morphology family 33 [Pseudohyphozyma bogoriensis]|nr:mitochondrial distribution and morphology family 33 [Pseudohyphozyma bogoriensis]
MYSITTRTRAKELEKLARVRVEAMELQKKFGEVGGRINEATGYEEIDRLRRGVGERAERKLLEVREEAARAKKTHLAAVGLRAGTQREVNDLLQRKSSWTSQDVVRFTDLIQQDHENERKEQSAKEAMEASEESVEKGFSDLMQAILERYHEEQVWSDKIRSLSTYGSLAITSLNVLIFVITILLVEPWKRKRLVEGVESRLRDNTKAGQETTNASLEALHSLLADAQTKLDVLLAPPLSPPPSTEAATPLPPSPIDEILLEEGAEKEEEKEETELKAVVERRFEEARKEREREMWIVGVGGVAAGLVLSSMVRILGR